MHCCYSNVFTTLELSNWQRLFLTSFKGQEFPISAPALLLLYSTLKKSVSVPSWQPYPRLATANADQQILQRSEYKTAICKKEATEHMLVLPN